MNDSRTRKCSAERRAEIIKAALAIAAETGPERMTVEAVAKRVGISQPAVFKHFASKAMIWEAVGEHIGDMIMDHLSQIAGDSSMNPFERLREMVIAHLSFIEETPAIPAILFSRELHAGNETLRQQFSKLVESRHKLFQELVEDAISQGYLRSGLRSRDASFLLLALVQGLAMRWSLMQRGFSLTGEGRRLLDLQLALFAPCERREGNDAAQPV